MGGLNEVSLFKQFYVNSYETDRNLNLKLNCLFQWFSEIAWGQVKQTDLGFEGLNNADKYWVLLGMNVKINRLPKWQDFVKIQTWPSGASGLYFTREFLLFDDKGDCLAAASSTWLIYDRVTLRPVVNDDIDYEKRTNSKKAVEQEFVKLRPFKNTKPQFDITAKYTDIDMHQHVNNSVYIKWIEDYFGNLELQTIKTIRIQYLKEVKLNDEIIVSFGHDNGIVYCEAILKSENKTCFRAEIETG